MATTKEQILNQQDAPVVEPPADAQPKQHNNGGTAPTVNNGNEAPVNNGSAVVGNYVAPDGDSEGGVVVKAPQPTSYSEQPKDAPVVPAGGGTKAKAAPMKPAAAPATTTTTTTTPADGGNQRMSYVEMFQKMSPYKPPTEEELEKERKKEKREKIFAAIGDGIAALSNLFFTTHGAPNAYDPKNSLSAKAKERWDKLKKERDENGRYYTAAYMQAMKNDEEGARDDRNWRHQLEREGIQDQRYADDIAHRDKREGIEDERYDANIKHRDAREAVEDQRWDKQFELQERQFRESIRQFNVTSAQNQQRINLESRRLAREMKNETVTFALGTGKGTISVPTNALNAANVSYIFSKLPANVRAQCQGEAIYDSKKRKVVGHKAPTTEAMLVCIGANIESSVEAQNALREIGGGKTQKQKTIGLK